MLFTLLNTLQELQLSCARESELERSLRDTTPHTDLTQQLEKALDEVVAGRVRASQVEKELCQTREETGQMEVDLQDRKREVEQLRGQLAGCEAQVKHYSQLLDSEQKAVADLRSNLQVNTMYMCMYVHV